LTSDNPVPESLGVLEFKADLSAPEIVATYDELPLWSAMFGLLLLEHVPLENVRLAVLHKCYIRTVGSGPAPIPPMGGRSPRRCGDDTGSMPRRRPSWSGTFRRLLHDLVTLARLGLTSRAHLAPENLFLRKQLALYQERRTKPRRPDLATRVALVLLSRVLDWRSMPWMFEHHIDWKSRTARGELVA
jgi:hypothetical protein